jgi:predicted deacylase
MSRVAVAGLAPGHGERCQGMVAVPGVSPAWELPVVVARGRAPGPTLVVTSGIHAAEYVPIEAVTQFARRLDLGVLRGTFIAVLIVNTPGFFERTIYVNPRDGKNINRVFPGSPDGTDSERVADFLVRKVIDGADAYIDAHCGDLIEALMPFTISIESGSAAVDERSAAMAQAFGLPYSMSITRDSIPGTSSGTASERGIPAIAAEAGQQGICDPAAVDIYYDGLYRVAAELDMLPSIGSPPPAAVPLREFAWLRAETTGTFLPRVQVGEQVAEGQLVGNLRDLFGSDTAEIRADAAGVVTFCVTCLPVLQGAPLLGIGVFA